MGEFNFEKALAMAKAAEQGEPLPPRGHGDHVKKPVTAFDFKTVVDRAKQGRVSKIHEDDGSSIEI